MTGGPRRDHEATSHHWGGTDQPLEDEYAAHRRREAERQASIDNGRAIVRADWLDTIMPLLDGAACAGTDPIIWFADRPRNPGDDGSHYREPKPVKTQRLRDMRRALAICAGCPVLASCAEYTQQHPEMTAYGIWAGTTADQRRRRQRGEQRKQVAA